MAKGKPAHPPGGERVRDGERSASEAMAEAANPPSAPAGQRGQWPSRIDARANDHIHCRPHRQRGFFVDFGCSSDAERECAAFGGHKRTGRIIKPLTVQEILDEEQVQKM